MRGSYALRDWEIPYLKNKMESWLGDLYSGREEEINLTAENICPDNIDTILTEHLGYEEYDYPDENNFDFWFSWIDYENHSDKVIWLRTNMMTMEMILFIDDNKEEM